MSVWTRFAPRMSNFSKASSGSSGQGRRGIARGLYVTAVGRRVGGLHAFAKKSRKMPRWALAAAREQMRHDVVTKLKALKKRFMEDPEFREDYALVEALVRARAAAKLTQAEVARRIGTTQSAIARLEGGRVSPSFATLRRYAEATGTRLTVGLARADG